MRAAIALLAVGLCLLAEQRQSHAQTPSPTVSLQATGMPANTATPTPADSPPVTSTTVPLTQAAAFTVAGALIEDLNRNGKLDSGDAAIKLETVVQLVPWARIPPATPDFDPRPFASGTANAAESNGPEIGVLTSNGLFAFTHIPPGDYTLRVWWEAGFPTGASASIPFVYQVVFSMSDDGAVGSPAVPPAEWKAVRGEPGNPEREVAVVGTVPTQILVNENPPGLVPFPVETDGASAALPVGSVDVAAAWTSSLGAVSVQLPSTGAGDDVDTRESLWLTGGGLALLAATGLALARRLRDGGRRAKR